MYSFWRLSLIIDADRILYTLYSTRKCYMFYIQFLEKLSFFNPCERTRMNHNLCCIITAAFADVWPITLRIGTLHFLATMWTRIMFGLSVQQIDNRTKVKWILFLTPSSCVQRRHSQTAKRARAGAQNSRSYTRSRANTHTHTDNIN